MIPGWGQLVRIQCEVLVEEGTWGGCLLGILLLRAFPAWQVEAAILEGQLISASGKRGKNQEDGFRLGHKLSARPVSVVTAAVGEPVASLAPGAASQRGHSPFVGMLR